jgi:hypothetical protein
MPNFDKKFIEKLNDLSIESVASKLGMEVKKHWALCPREQGTGTCFTENLSQ